MSRPLRPGDPDYTKHTRSTSIPETRTRSTPASRFTYQACDRSGNAPEICKCKMFYSYELCREETRRRKEWNRKASDSSGPLLPLPPPLTCENLPGCYMDLPCMKRNHVVDGHVMKIIDGVQQAGLCGGKEHNNFIPREAVCSRARLRQMVLGGCRRNGALGTFQLLPMPRW